MAPRRSNACTGPGIEKPSVSTILPATGSGPDDCVRAASGVSNKVAVPAAYRDGT